MKPYTEQILWISTALLVLALLLRPTRLPDIDLGSLNRLANSHETLVGAFLGALAAPLGIVSTDIVRERRTRDHERRKMHYNRICLLQAELNTIRATLEDNLGIIDTIVEANAQGVPTLQRPVQAAYDATALQDLYDIVLINRLYQLYYDLRRFNLDMSNLSNVLDRLAEEKFSGKITAEQYKQYVATINPQVETLRSSLVEELNHGLMDAIAYTRICSDMDASKEMRNRLERILKNRPAISAKDLQAARKIIDSELAEDGANRSLG